MAGNLQVPVLASIFGILFTACMFVWGTVRDWLNVKSKPRKGYAPIRGKQEDFYNRRVYGRMSDCWNRPICSAPGAWIDLMEREDLNYTAGVATRGCQKIQLAGSTKRCLNLASYNYLGFAAQDDYCTPRALGALENFGVSTCSARAEGGTTTVHVELENIVAQYLGLEAALTFGMGFATNSAIIPCLVGKGCLVLSDELNHASIVAGVRSSGAKTLVFRHNDANHMEELLREAVALGQPRTRRPWKKVLVIVEGIYSMEGEIPPLKAIVELKKKYKAYLWLDEAHSIGALGATGRGCCEVAGVSPKDVDIMMGTFTKSFGSCGGYVAGSKQLIDFLKQHSPSHLYATSMAPGAAQQIVSAFEVIMGKDGSSRGQDKIRQLRDNALYLRKKLLDMGLHAMGFPDSPVVPVMLYHPALIASASRIALQHHVALCVVGFPATAFLEGRIRICVSAAHTREDLDYALEVLGYVAQVCNIRYGKQVHLREEMDQHLSQLQDKEAAQQAAARAGALARQSGKGKARSLGNSGAKSGLLQLTSSANAHGAHLVRLAAVSSSGQ